MNIKSTLIAVLIWGCGAPPPARADEASAQLKSLVAKAAPSIVTVNAILKTEFKGGGQAQDSESRISVQGIVVDTDGMVVVSNSYFSAKRMMEMMGGGGDAGGFGVKMSPSGFKVIVEKEEKEYDAFLVATDAKYDLAFLKLEGLGDRKLQAVDFSKSASPAFGDRVICVSRLGKGYDYSPFFQAARINCEIAKPLKAWMVDGTVSGAGLPVFTEAGEVIGILSSVPSGVKDDAGTDRMGMGFIFQMFSGGGRGMGGEFLLPGGPVKALVEQAKVQAVTVAAERAKKKSVKPGTGTPKATGNKPPV